jgi:hypothetical protein
LNGQVQNLNGQVGSLNQPNNPLSAWNAICNQGLQNSQTQQRQTYYFPCTNSAHTVPEQSH